MSRPGTTAELVALALVRTRLSRAAEALLLGVAAGLAAASAVELSGARANSLAALAAAGVSASACAATWWCEHRRAALDVARAADQRLQQRGALVTAFEHERQGGLAAMLAARMLGRLPDGAAARAAPAPAVAFLAAPLAAAALLAALAQRPAAVASDVLELAQRASAELARASGSGAGAEREAAQLARSAAEAVSAAAAGTASPAQAAGELQRAEERLTALVAERQARGEFDPALWSARDLTREALLRLARAGDGGVPGLSGGDPGQPGAASALKNDGQGSTMGGSPSDTPLASPSPPVQPGPAAAEDEVGTVAGRWWPRQYDAIVAHWFTAREDD